MKMRFFRLSERYNFDDVSEIVRGHMFKHKPDEEVSEIVFRSGFLWDNEIGIGDSSLIYIKYRVDERQLPSGVKKRLLGLKSTKEALANIKRKSDKKQFVEELLHQARLQVPFSRFEYRIFMNDKYLILVDCPKKIETGLTRAFSDFIDCPVTFSPSLLKDEFSIDEDKIIISPCKGSHKVTKADNQVSITGVLDKEEFSSASKITCVSTNYGRCIIFTVTDDHLFFKPKDLLMDNQNNEASVLDTFSYAFESIHDMIIDPISRQFAYE